MGLDFRQHVAGLVSVFLALVVGIFIGVVLSSEEKLGERMNLLLKESREIRDENSDLRGHLKQAEKELERRAELEREVLPALVGGQIEGVSVALIYADDVRRVKFECDLPTLMSTAGANMVSEASLSRDFESVVGRIKLAQAEEAGLGPNISPATVAAKIAQLVLSGNGKGLQALDSLSLIRASGSYRTPPDVVIVFAAPEEDDESRLEAVDSPLLKALVARGAFVVVGLAREVSRDMAASYRRRGMRLIEAANTIPGQVELVDVVRERLR